MRMRVGVMIIPKVHLDIKQQTTLNLTEQSMSWPQDSTTFAWWPANAAPQPPTQPGQSPSASGDNQAQLSSDGKKPEQTFNFEDFEDLDNEELEPRIVGPQTPRKQKKVTSNPFDLDLDEEEPHDTKIVFSLDDFYKEKETPVQQNKLPMAAIPETIEESFERGQESSHQIRSQEMPSEDSKIQAAKMFEEFQGFHQEGNRESQQSNQLSGELNFDFFKLGQQWMGAPSPVVKQQASLPVQQITKQEHSNDNRSEESRVHAAKNFEDFFGTMGMDENLRDSQVKLPDALDDDFFKLGAQQQPLSTPNINQLASNIHKQGQPQPQVFDWQPALDPQVKSNELRSEDSKVQAAKVFDDLIHAEPQRNSQASLSNFQQAEGFDNHSEVDFFQLGNQVKEGETPIAHYHSSIDQFYTPKTSLHIDPWAQFGHHQEPEESKVRPDNLQVEPKQQTIIQEPIVQSIANPEQFPWAEPEDQANFNSTTQNYTSQQQKVQIQQQPPPPQVLLPPQEQLEAHIDASVLQDPMDDSSHRADSHTQPNDPWAQMFEQYGIQNLNTDLQGTKAPKESKIPPVNQSQPQNSFSAPYFEQPQNTLLQSFLNPQNSSPQFDQNQLQSQIIQNHMFPFLGPDANVQIQQPIPDLFNQPLDNVFDAPVRSHMGIPENHELVMKIQQLEQKLEEQAISMQSIHQQYATTRQNQSENSSSQIIQEIRIMEQKIVQSNEQLSKLNKKYEDITQQWQQPNAETQAIVGFIKVLEAKLGDSNQQLVELNHTLQQAALVKQEEQQQMLTQINQLDQKLRDSNTTFARLNQKYDEVLNHQQSMQLEPQAILLKIQTLEKKLEDSTFQLVSINEHYKVSLEETQRYQQQDQENMFAKIHNIETKIEESNYQLVQMSEKYEQMLSQKGSMVYSPEANVEMLRSRRMANQQQISEFPAGPVPTSPLDVFNLDQVENINRRMHQTIQPFVSRYYEPTYYHPSGTMQSGRWGSGDIQNRTPSMRSSQMDHGFDQSIIKIKTNGVFITKHMQNPEHIDQFKRMCQQESCAIIDTYEIYVTCRYETLTVQNDRQRAYNVVKLVVTYKNKSHMTMNHLVVIVNTQKVNDRFQVEPLKISRPQLLPGDSIKQEFMFSEFDASNQVLSCAVGYMFNYLKRSFTILLARPLSKFLEAEFLGADDLAEEFHQQHDRLAQSEMFDLGMRSLDDVVSIFSWMIHLQQQSEDMQEIGGSVSFLQQGEIVDVLIRVQQAHTGKCVVQTALLNSSNLKLSESILSYFAFVLGK